MKNSATDDQPQDQTRDVERLPGLDALL